MTSKQCLAKAKKQAKSSSSLNSSYPELIAIEVARLADAVVDLCEVVESMLPEEKEPTSICKRCHLAIDEAFKRVGSRGGIYHNNCYYAGLE